MTFSTCFCHNPLQCMASKKVINCNLTGSSHGRIYDEVPPKMGWKKMILHIFFLFPVYQFYTWRIQGKCHVLSNIATAKNRIFLPEQGIDKFFHQKTRKITVFVFYFIWIYFDDVIMTKYCIKVKKSHMTDSFFFFINDMKYHVLPHIVTDYVYIFLLWALIWLLR